MGHQSYTETTVSNPPIQIPPNVLQRPSIKKSVATPSLYDFMYIVY
jgi:hypothetical protein